MWEVRVLKQLNLRGKFLGGAALALTLCNAAGAQSAEQTEAAPQRDARSEFRIETVVVSGALSSGEGQKIESRKLTAHKVVDLAEVLSDELVEVQMIRKGTYGNEISLRGVGQENMKVLLDGGIIEGSCGGRKDPSLSHINMLTVQSLVVREGPFDVTKPGYLGGYVNVITKKPKPGFETEVLGRAGSYGFTSIGFFVNGGDETFQALAGYNFSEAGQYEDGAGHKIWESRQGMSAPYNDKGRTANSFRKNDVWGKVQITPGEHQTILLEHSYGLARDILTPRTTADTAKEVTNLTKVSWEIRDLGEASKALSFTFYRNKVDHYPNQKFRAVAVPTNNVAISTIMGGGVQNVTATEFATFTYGVDVYHRDWYVDVYNSLTGVKANDYLIPSVETVNVGGYMQANKQIGALSLELGMRYDSFRQEAAEALKFTSLVTNANRRTDQLMSGSISVEYALSPGAILFSGVGRNYRTPMSTEGYIQGNAAFFGNPELKPTANTEFDIGFRAKGDGWKLQAKGFYSDLGNYIYQQKALAGYKSYTNIDAHITGGDVTASTDLGYGVSLEGGLAYQLGRKDSYPVNNTDHDLGQIAPLKGRLALNYNNDKPFGQEDAGLFGTFELVHSNAASDIDEAVGEKRLASWDVFNLRLGYRFEAWTLNLGVENLFDRQYTVANSYEWDVVAGTGANPVIVNEPGRFIYASVAFDFSLD
jgi:iron complex outermembrane receptor protein